MEVNLEKFNNRWYKPGAGIIKRFLWYYTNLIWFKSGFPISNFKVFLLRLFGAQIGRGVVIKPGVNIKYPWRLSIGNHVWIGENVWIDNLDDVRIGNNVCISQGAMLLCGNHNYKTSEFDLITKPIVLEDGVWIGAKSVVCPGVVCSTHSVLTVGSVASRNLNSYSINTGNPACEVRRRILSS